MDKNQEVETSRSQEPEAPSRIAQADEIDLVELAKVIWSRRWFIAKVTGVFFLLGLVIAFTSPKEYKSSTTLIPEAAGAEGGLSGSLGGLAALAGVNLGDAGTTSTLNPALYRSIAESTPFLLDLMNKEFYFEELGKEVSLYNYSIEYQHTSLFSKVLSIPFRLVGLVMPKSSNVNEC